MKFINEQKKALIIKSVDYGLMGIVCFFYIIFLIYIIVECALPLPNSDMQAGFILGCCTVLGACFVIVAAKIQADGVTEQIEAEKAAELRKEDMQYLGWITLQLNDIYRIYSDARNKKNIWQSLLMRDPSLETIKDIKSIDWFRPQYITIDNNTRNLYVKLPTKIVDAMNDGKYEHREWVEALDVLSIFLLTRNSNSSISELERFKDKISECMQAYINKYERVMPLGAEHLKNMSVRLISERVEF